MQSIILTLLTTGIMGFHLTNSTILIKLLLKRSIKTCWQWESTAKSKFQLKTSTIRRLFNIKAAEIKKKIISINSTAKDITLIIKKKKNCKSRILTFEMMTWKKTAKNGFQLVNYQITTILNYSERWNKIQN